MRKRSMKVLTGVLASVSILFGIAAQPVQAMDGYTLGYDENGAAVVYDPSGKAYTSSPYLEHLVKNFTAVPGDGSVTLNWEFTGVKLSDGRVELYATTEDVTLMEQTDLQLGMPDKLPAGEDYYVPVMIAGRGPQCTSYTYTGLTNGTTYYFVMVTNIDGSDTVYTTSAIPGTAGQEPAAPDQVPSETVRNFVSRLYRLILNREADIDGLNSWSQQLIDRTATGAQIVQGFVESEEFAGRGLSNEEVVEIMYQAMLGRNSDKDGKNAWTTILDDGCSYLYIVNGFSGSAEFGEICGNYGITAGTVELNRQRDKNPELTAFVARCYTQALDRQYETDGLEAWCDAIISGRNTPKQVAQNFIFSDEFTQKNLDSEEYVKVLYRTFMGREADEGGLAAWVEVLESGREDCAKVLEGFSDSAEFDGILQSFGLN